MHLKIASRSSDLARWQAFEVERSIKEKFPHITTELIFKSSFGDRNLDLPLSQMESRGVFTEDFYQDLLNEQYDLVVHSWKDLPVEDRAGACIIATLKREDVRDVLLVPNTVWTKSLSTGHLKILTSSPRRIYNLTNCLKELLPTSLNEIEYAPVRGNIPSRVGKMFEQNSALVLAKAALDRMLTPHPGFEAIASQLRSQMDQCRFMVLPLSLNPTAPAQGALAIEISDTREDLKEIFSQLNHLATFNDVLEERKTLKSHGGGCHQKIGMNVLSKGQGVYRILRGLTDQGQILNETSFESLKKFSFQQEPQAKPEEIFPLVAKDNSWFSRERVPLAKEQFKTKAILVSRSMAATPELKSASQIWTPGLESWKKLAQAGFWINGCFEGFGQEERHWVGPLLNGLDWLKLSHETSEDFSEDLPVLASYRLLPLPPERSPNLNGKKYFFWMSASTFMRAKSLYPNEVNEGFHGCGPGITARFLTDSGIEPGRIQTFLSLQDFLEAIGRPE